MADLPDIAEGKRAFVAVVIALLKDEPGNWATDQMPSPYTIVHKPTGLQVWCSNGRGFVGLWRPEKIEFTWFERWKAWRYVKRILAEAKRAAEQAELERLHRSLKGMADNVVSIRTGRAA